MHVDQSGQYHADLGGAVIVGIKAKDGSISSGGECENLVRTAPLTTRSNVSTTGFER